MNLDGVEVKEYWSFNAIVNALSRKTYVKEAEQKDWSNLEDLINAYQDMENDLVESISDGSQALAETLMKTTFAELIEEEGYSEVVAKLVVTESGKEVLYVVGKEGNNWKLVDKFGIYKSAKDAIESAYSSMAGTAITLTEDPELLDTDEKLVANEYIAENFEWTTLQEVADEFEIPLEELRVYATVYSYSGGTGADAAVVRQIGNYFVVIEWL